MMVNNNNEILAEAIKLHLESGEVIEGLKCGIGPIPCIIAGPGSFYFGKLSENLKQQMTFYAFDDEWAVNKGETIDATAIEQLQFDSLLSKVKNIVMALKHNFNYPKIGLMGFSAPGLIATGAAKAIGSEHIAFVIGSGVAASQLDPEFKLTNTYFDKHADNERKNS